MEIDAKHKVFTYQCSGNTYVLNMFNRRYMSRYYLSRVPHPLCYLCYLGYLCIQYECRGFRRRSVADARAGVPRARARSVSVSVPAPAPSKGGTTPRRGSRASSRRRGGRRGARGGGNVDEDDARRGAGARG